MKKIILAACLAVLASYSLAKPVQTASTSATQNGVYPEFAEVERLIQANNYTAAYQLLNELAAQGSAQAIYNLGYLTQTGQGTNKDEKKAIQLYQQSAREGYAIANYILGKNYAEGSLGLKQDMNKAKEYLEKASLQKLEDASIDLATILFTEDDPKSHRRGLDVLQPLVDKNHPRAQYTHALYTMSIGIQRKDEKIVQQGLRTIQNLATSGFVPAIMGIANMLVAGNIVEQDLIEARRLFAELAKNNIPEAQESLDAVNKIIAQQAKNDTKAKVTRNKS